MALIFTLLCSWWLLSEKRRIQWIYVNATFSSITFQSDMRNCKVAAWKRCQTPYLTTICNLKRHFYLYVLVCGCYHVQKYLIWMLWPKCWVCYEAYCSHSFFLFHSWPLYWAKSRKTQYTVFGYTKESKIEHDKICWSATPNLWVLSFAIFDSWPFYQLKAENRKIPFLVTKRGQKFNPTRFSDPRPPTCG